MAPEFEVRAFGLCHYGHVLKMYLFLENIFISTAGGDQMDLRLWCLLSPLPKL